ncbi:Adipocyte plasma membrane-associated protein [Trichostrongylus colubriformis]|uniref:Adipocyte plasma membrane-associated protein n=1 Tax=Trichostrongylus colubriformis TaxID=6319 RepID=A0AAN8F0M1_TRICO
MTKAAVNRSEVKHVPKKPDETAANKPLLIVSAVVASVAVAVACTHLFVSSPIDPVEFSLPPPLPFVKELAPNQRLAEAELLLEDQIYGPESIAVNRKTKKIYTGLKTGLICEIELDGKGKILRAVRLTSLEGCDGSYHSMPKCGRPLGMRIHPQTEELYVLDAYLGLFSINWETEKVRQHFAGGAVITDDASAIPTRYLNDFDFLPDGSLVISESSTKFDDRDFIYDLLEHRANGRLLAYNPETEELSVLLDHLYFPNGVQVIRGKVLIAEMGKARILKFSPSSGNPSVFTDSLPGYPDNIRQASDGNLWVPIAATRSESDNWLAARPSLRSLMTKLLSPQAVHVVAEWMTNKYGLVLKVINKKMRPRATP